MPKGSEVKEIIRAFTGQKSAIASGLLQPTDAERILNFTTRRGRLRKFWGASVYANPEFGNGFGVTWIDRFRQRWFFQRGDFIGRETGETSKQFDHVGSFIQGDTTRVRSEKWRDRLYMVNSVENKFFEERPLQDPPYAFQNIGIFPPGNNRNIVINSFGDTQNPILQVTPEFDEDGELSGIWQYTFTWFDARTNTESMASDSIIGTDGLWTPRHIGDPLVGFGDGSAQNTARVNIALAKALGFDADRVTHWILYRRPVSDGINPDDDYKRVMTSESVDSDLFDIPELIPIATEEVFDYGEAVSSVLNEGNSPPPSGRFLRSQDINDSSDVRITGPYGPKFIRRHNDQIWLFGVSLPIVEQSGNGFVTTKIVSGVAYASAVSNPDYYLYTYDIGYADDQKDTGIAKHRNTLMFFKEKSIYYLDGTNPENYAVRELDNKRGAVSPGSIQETPIGVIGLAADGFILVDSASPAKLISEEIEDEIRQINFTQSEKIISSYDIQEGKYECHAPMRSSMNANKVFIYDVNTKSWDFRDKAVGASSAFSLDSNKRRVGLVGDQQSSRLYDVADESVVTFNGQKITGKWSSRQFDFGEPDKQKRLVSMRIKARCAGKFLLDIDVIMDEGQQQTYSLREIDSETIFSTWAESQDDSDGDELVLDEGQYAADLSWKKFEILLSGVARNFKVAIKQSEMGEASRGFEIDEIVFVGNMLGR
jgi:hypothetical protein